MVRQRLAEIEKGRTTPSLAPSTVSSALPPLNDRFSVASKYTHATISSTSPSRDPRSERIRIAFEKIEELARRDAVGSPVVHGEDRSRGKPRTLETVLEEFDSPVTSAPRSLSPVPLSPSSCYPATTSSEEAYPPDDPSPEHPVSSHAEATSHSLISHYAPGNLASLLANQQAFLEQNVSILRGDIERVANNSAPFSELVVDIFKSMMLLGEALEKVEDIGLGGLEEIQSLKALVTNMQNMQKDIHAASLNTQIQGVKIDEWFAVILDKLEDIRALNDQKDTRDDEPPEGRNMAIMNNLRPSSTENKGFSSHEATLEPFLQDIHRKLDQLQLAINEHTSKADTQTNPGTSSSSPLDRNQVHICFYIICHVHAPEISTNSWRKL
jgi:hypothetical protein